MISMFITPGGILNSKLCIAIVVAKALTQYT